MDFIQANDAIINAVRQNRATVRAIREDLRIPDQNKDKLIQQQRDQDREALAEQVQQKQVQQIKAGIETRRAELKDQLQRSYMPAGDPLAGRAEDEATWRRVRSLLDRGMPETAVIQDTVERGDRRTLKVLGQELRTYQAAKTGSFDGADAADGLLDQARYQTGNAEYKAAADALADLDQAEYFINANANRADTDLNSDHSEAGRTADIMFDGKGGVTSLDAA